MEETKYRLSDIADVQTGPFGSQLHNEDYVSSGTPIVTVEHLGNRKFTTQNLPMVSDADKIRLSKYSLKTGDIVFSRVGSVDRCSYVSDDENGWLFSGRCLRVRCSDKVMPLYLYYFFCLPSVKQYIRNIAVGATMPSINTSLLSEIQLELPDMSTQRTVAGILSSIDDKIELNKRINDNLEQQAQALFRSWFIDFNPFKEGKFAESELGMIPEEWRVGNFMDLISVGSGGTPKTDVLEYWNGKIPFFSPKDTSTPVFTHSTEKYITDSGLAKCNSQLYPRNTVFITARGTVGKVRMAGCDMAMNQSNYALISKIAGAEYFIYLYTLELIERIVKKANGAVFSAITVKDFNEPIIIAPQRVLADFLAIVKPIFEMIHKNGLENRNLAELRDSLLPKLMSGELKIEEMNR